jgi:hypothetical protein
MYYNHVMTNVCVCASVSKNLYENIHFFTASTSVSKPKLKFWLYLNVIYLYSHY